MVTTMFGYFSGPTCSGSEQWREPVLGEHVWTPDFRELFFGGCQVKHTSCEFTGSGIETAKAI